ncbi:hypothetical protein H257_04754 [Aphanomyces astaci]|uniref:Uncharacterized protein n=1 Tax=Aphanomyces astaci TaxID=112090 RepID=W4GUL7_APHAT|nr:hypothetical protein H257_04754 [Aphanomyces astaci]ETV83006.1 hypothetical protein H257_04754 [Aphanomyces astaci]|eukprot:XP_009827677.1 hypothetical protein H257_04754 [Aphanomyces astaci]
MPATHTQPGLIARSNEGCDYQRSQSPVNGTERFRSLEAERGRPVHRPTTTKGAHTNPVAVHLIPPRQLRHQLAPPTFSLSPMAMTWVNATSVFVYNAPALLDPPSFNDSTKLERRIFIRQYDKYLDQVNALQLNGSRPFAMPVSACRDVLTKKRMAM